jgi:predicted dehydrogenase
MNRYKICVMGSGYMAGKHCMVLQNHPQVELFGLIGSHSGNTLNNFIQRYEFKNIFTKISDALESDIFIICSPNSFHAEQVCEILNEGKHVLCEKPLAYTESEMNTIASVLKKSKGILQVGMNCRFRMQYSGIKKILDAGSLGDIKFIKGTYIFNLISAIKNREKAWWLDYPDGSFNYLHTGAIHSLDLMRWFGGNIVSVSSIGNAFELNEEWGKDTFAVNILFESGTIGNFICSASALTLPDFSFEIWGTKGYIKGSDIFINSGKGLEQSPINTEQKKPDLELQFEDLLHCINTGNKTMNSFEEAVGNFNLIKAVEQSVKEQKTVTLKK